MRIKGFTIHRTLKIVSGGYLKSRTCLQEAVLLSFLLNIYLFIYLAAACGI